MAGRGAWRAGRCIWISGVHAVKNGRQRGVATLAYDEVLVPEKPSEGMRNVLFLHGLLGSGKNWRSFAKLLASSALERSPPNSPGFRMILVDLRNHGNSATQQGFAPPHDMPAAARDVAELVKASSWGSPEMVISHSMGGKVALDYGRKSAQGEYGDVAPPKQLWVLDSVPGKVPMRNSEGEVEQVLSTIQSLPDPLPSRRWLVDHMTKAGFSKGLADWLGSNLKRVKPSGEEMTWIFNPKEAHDMFESYGESDYWSVLESPPEGMNIGIVRAAKSDRWTPDIISKLESLSKRTGDKGGRVAYHILEDAGHWLHIDNPDGLSNILLPPLVNVST
ncbi:unnamed protein product [Calypogeia fissa]